MLELTAGGVVAVHDSSLGFRHGPKSILDDRTLVVVFVSSYPYTRQYDLDIVRELRRSVPQRDVLTVSAGDEPNLATENDWHVTGVDDADDALLALPFILLAQLLALHTSVRLGRTPRQPFPDGRGQPGGPRRDDPSPARRTVKADAGLSGSNATEQLIGPLAGSNRERNHHDFPDQAIPQRHHRAAGAHRRGGDD